MKTFTTISLLNQIETKREFLNQCANRVNMLGGDANFEMTKEFFIKALETSYPDDILLIANFLFDES